MILSIRLGLTLYNSGVLFFLYDSHAVKLLLFQSFYCDFYLLHSFNSVCITFQMPFTMSAFKISPIFEIMLSHMKICLEKDTYHC